MLKELRIVFDICFCQSVKNQQTFTMNLENCLPTPNHLLNFTYSLLNSLELSFSDADLVQYIFTESIKPLFSFLTELVFKGNFQDDHNEFFIEYNSIIEEYDLGNSNNIPNFLMSILKDILECANNMLLFKYHERDYYDLCKEDFSNLMLIFVPEEIQEHQCRIKNIYDMKQKVLDKISFDLRVILF